MTYRRNWLRHLLAPLTGEGLSTTLARDFWRADEDLFNPKINVQWRWLKLLHVHFASALAQITLPVFVVTCAVVLQQRAEPKWILIITALSSVAGLLFALIFATASYVAMKRKQQR